MATTNQQLDPAQIGTQTMLQQRYGTPPPVDTNNTQQAFQGTVMNELAKMKNQAASSSSITSDQYNSQIDGLKKAVQKEKDTPITSSSNASGDADSPIVSSVFDPATGRWIDTGTAYGQSYSNDQNLRNKYADAIKNGTLTEEQKAELERSNATLEASRVQQKTLNELNEKDRIQRAAINTIYDNQEKDAKARQASEMGQSRLGLARMGALGESKASDAYISKVQSDHDREIGRINALRNQALREAEMALGEGSAAAAQKRLDTLKQLRDEAVQAQKDRLDNLIKYNQLKKYETDNAMDSINNIVKAGMNPDDIPKGYLQDIEERAGLPNGFANAFYQTAKKANDLQKVKDDAERKKMEIELTKNAIDVAKILPPDQQVEIPLPGGTSIKVSGKDVQETKQYKAETPDGQFVVTTDLRGNELSRIKLGDNFVAPHYDEDRGRWVAYNISQDKEVIIQDNGPHGEGARALTDAPSLVKQLSDRFGKPVQEPGGKFSHANIAGYDFMAPQGSKIESPFSGVVVATGKFDKNIKNITHTMNDYGTYVDVLDAKKGYVVRYAHLSNLDVKTGDKVNAGDVLGASGNTGFSTGPHIHLEFRTSEDKAIRPSEFAQLENGAKPIGGSEAVGAPKVSTAKSDEIKRFEEETGYIYDASSIHSQDKFATWKKEKQSAEDKKTAKRPLESSQANLLADGKNLNNVLNPIEELFSKDNLFGPVTGTSGSLNVYNVESQDAQAIIKRATQVIGSYLERGVLRKEDEIKYTKMLPQLTDTKEVAQKKLEGVRRLVEDKQREYLDAYDKAGYDVSNFTGNINTSEKESPLRKYETDASLGPKIKKAREAGYNDQEIAQKMGLK